MKDVEEGVGHREYSKYLFSLGSYQLRRYKRKMKIQKKNLSNELTFSCMKKTW